jgi:hypothetical protein
MMSEQTTTINGRGGPELFKALAEFHKTKPVAVMDSVNAGFNSEYASISAVREAAYGAAEFGLVVTQLVGVETVTTMLCHESGQYLSTETCIIRTRDNVHGFGSGITYSCRYAAAAILGIPFGDKDDDGNAAAESQRKAKHSKDFKEDKTKFMWPRLKEIGLDSKEVNDYVVTFKRKRLSALSKTDVDTLLDGLAQSGSDIRNHFDTWRENRG